MSSDPDRSNRFHRRFKAMGSPCTIDVYADDRGTADAAMDASQRRIEELERTYSRYLTGNTMDRVNRSARAGVRCAIDSEFAALLDYADTCYKASNGLFDITSGILRRAWDFKSGTCPSHEDIETLRPAIGWDKISWSRDEIRFARPGMELDFGGVVKEYAADAAASLLEAHGLRHGQLNLGGDIRVIGPHPDGRPWAIGIRHPRAADEFMGSVEITKGALASSGDYERFMEIDGVLYSHILNPKTGWPVTGLAAVSVLAEHCVVAGSSCTIAMLKGIEGTAWLETLEVPFIAMDTDGNITWHRELQLHTRNR